jgi:hypothetical protein
MELRNLWLAGLAMVTTVAAHPQLANNPGIALQDPDHYSLLVGDVKITALSDGTVPQDLHVLLRNTTNEKTDALLAEGFLSNPVEASINAYLFQDGNRLVLVDTGSGEFFGPGIGGKLLSSLASVGISPQQITDVLLTHAHDDHMGGLVRGARLTFPNTTVHLGKPILTSIGPDLLTDALCAGLNLSTHMASEARGVCRMQVDENNQIHSDSGSGTLSQQAGRNDQSSTEFVGSEPEYKARPQEVVWQTRRLLLSRRIPHLTGGISTVHWH